MAKVREITVGFAYRLGFVNSYSSAEMKVEQVIQLEEGDNAVEIRKSAVAKLKKYVTREVHEFRAEHDKKVVRER